MAYEAYWDDVVLALRCDGTLPITDDKGNTVTNTGVTLHSAVSDSGGVSARFGSATARLEVAGSADFNLGIDPWTLLLTTWIDDAAGYRSLFERDGDSRLALWVDEGNLYIGVGAFLPAENTGWSASRVNCGPVTSGAMTRIMVSRSYRRLQVFVNGALRHMFHDDSPWSWPFYINGYVGVTPTIFELPFDFSAGLLVGNDSWLTGYQTGASMDEIYLVKGVALETSPYVPAPLFVVGLTLTGASELPILVSARASGVSSLPIIVSTGVTGAASVGLDVAVVDAAYLSGASLASDGGTAAGSWSPVVTIGGINRTADIVGEIDIDAGRGAARIASFALKATGIINPTALVGQRVSIGIATAAGNNRMRLFTGRINEPRLDMVGGTIAVSCTDDLQNVVNAMPRAALDALIGGRWSAAVFDDAAAGWVYAQDRLSTVPASLDLSPWGALRVTPWEAGAADLSFDGNSILQQSVSVGLAARSGLVNEVAVDFGYRFPMAKRETFRVQFEYLTNGFGPWVDAGNGFLSRAAVTAGIEAAGGAIYDMQWISLPTTAQLINTGGGGVAPWLPNPATDPLFCLGFDALVHFDYTQEIDERHAATVRSPASVAAMGTLRETVSGSLRGETADTLATETNAHLWQLGLSNIPPVDAPAIVIGQTTAEAMTLTADTNRAAAEAALATLVDVAKVKVIAGHMETTVAAAVALHPLVDLDKTITIAAQGVTATGRVSQVRHRMSASDSGEAVTEFEISLCRLSGVGIADVETPTAAPAGVADGATGPLAPVVCVFNGLVTQDQSFEITFPAVEASQRDAAEVVIDSAFDVALVEDALVIDMGA